MDGSLARVLKTACKPVAFSEPFVRKTACGQTQNNWTFLQSKGHPRNIFECLCFKIYVFVWQLSDFTKPRSLYDNKNR